jgi:hypothetical protein
MHTGWLFSITQLWNNNNLTYLSPMGGGASKRKQVAPTTPIKDVVPEKEIEFRGHIPTLVGPKNGELAPIPTVQNLPKVSLFCFILFFIYICWLGFF